MISPENIHLQVKNMEVVERILNETKYHDVKHPDFGTVMRMADKVLPFSLKYEPAKPWQ